MSNLPWWETEGVLDGSHPHEPIAFMLRRGGVAEDIEEQYERAFSQAGAQRVADSGANFVETCFFKGLGLQFERPEMERTRRFIQFAHNLGLRVGVYTQWGSIFNETFFHEEPAARGWVQIGVDGRPIEYYDLANQYFRWRGCPGNNDFLAYLRKAIDVAIKEFHADIVYFDNMCLFENHDTLCYCPACREGFRAHLRAKFPTPEAMFKRMGIRSAEHVEPPVSRPWTEHTLIFHPIRDPLMQEFIEFRCKQLADAWHEIYGYIKSVNPDAGIMGNPSFPRKYNERLTSAIDFWLLRQTPGMYYMENAVRGPGLRDGAVVSNVRGYRYGRALGNVRFVPCGSSATPGLSYCEGLAFNDGSGHAGVGYEPYKEFFETHREEFYRGVEPAADIAVLRDDNSLTLRWHEAFTVMELAQQELLCAGVPWMPLWRQQFHDSTLAKYRVLVLPGNACVSRDDVAVITKYVADGGGLVLLENTGTYNEYHQTIRRWRFADLFDPDGKDDGFAIRYGERGAIVEFARNARPLFASVGKGKVAYLPQIRATREPVRTYAEIGGYDGFQHLQLPRDWRKLAATVEKVRPADAATRPTLRRVAGPVSVFAEALRKTDSGTLLVHLVNYAPRRVAAGVAIELAAQAKSAKLYLPGEKSAGRPVALKPARQATTKLKLPAFGRYALVVVEDECG
jgi:hypothetical protein